MKDLTALIVDDDPSIGNMLGAILRTQKISSQYAPNGRVALELLARNTYDLILLDLMMPIINGVQVIEYLKEHQPTQLRRTVVLSAANAKELDKVRGDIYGALQKPFDINKLQNYLNEIRAIS